MLRRCCFALRVQPPKNSAFRVKGLGFRVVLASSNRIQARNPKPHTRTLGVPSHRGICSLIRVFRVYRGVAGGSRPRNMV